MSCFDAALRAVASGISVIPILADGSKRPAVPKWGKYTEEVMNEKALAYWFDDSPDHGIAFVMGAISEDLECLDFDSHDAYEDWRKAVVASGLDELLMTMEDGYLERSPNGMHLIYRCDAAEPNQKLSMVDGKAIIETRGHNGYVITAPSCGGVHPSFRPYELVSGSIESVPTITGEARESLFNIARMLGDKVAVGRAVEARQVADRTSASEGTRPGDDWAAQHDWHDVLVEHGWKHLFSSNGEGYWCRPGKSKGISATTNYAGSGYLYVFSTSTEFESGRGYSLFSAYALLNHASDFEAAARELAAGGYGDERIAEPDSIVNIDGVMSMDEAARTIAAEPSTPTPEPPALVPSLDTTFPQEFCNVPGLVGDVFKHILITSLNPQPALALAGAILTCATLMGRKVQSPTGLRTNVYAVGLARSGYGKEDVLRGMRDIFEAIGAPKMACVEDVTSDAAIFHALSRQPSSVFMLDEIGRLLARWEGMGAGITTTIIKLHGRAASTLAPKAYAKPKKGENEQEPIVWPNLSLFGLSVPHTFWDTLTSGSVSDGFLNRILLFQAPLQQPKFNPVLVTCRLPNERILTQARDWLKVGGQSDAELYASALEGKTKAPHCITLDYSAESAELFDAHRKWTRDRQYELNECEKHSQSELYARLSAHAIQLATIRAAGKLGPQYGEIQADDARWGIDLANFCVARMQAGVAQNVADDDHERDQLKVLDVIRKVGGSATRTDLSRGTRWKRTRLSEVLQSLVDAGTVVQATRDTKTKPSTVYEIQ